MAAEGLPDCVPHQVPNLRPLREQGGRDRRRAPLGRALCRRRHRGRRARAASAARDWQGVLMTPDDS